MRAIHRPHGLQKLKTKKARLWRAFFLWFLSGGVRDEPCAGV